VVETPKATTVPLDVLKELRFDRKAQLFVSKNVANHADVTT
jgi:hypothetical protein